MEFLRLITKSAPTARDKLAYSKLSTLKKIEQACKKEIDELERQLPILEINTPREIDTIHRIFNIEDYPGQRAATQKLRYELISALELKLKQTKDNLDKMKKLHERVNPLIKEAETELKKLFHTLGKRLGSDISRSISTFIDYPHDKSHGKSNNHKRKTLGGKKMNKGSHTRKRKNKSFPKK